MSTPTPQSRTPWRYLLWLAWVLAWLAVAAFIVLLATTAALREPGPLVSLLLAAASGVVAGGFAFGFGAPETHAPRSAAKVAGAVAVVMIVVIGLWSLGGPLAAGLLLVGVTVTSPTVVGMVRSRRRRTARPAVARRSVYGPAALRSANEAELAELERRSVPGTRPEPEGAGSIDMTAFEVALLSIEAEGEALPTQPSSTEVEDGTGMRGLDIDGLCGVWRRSSVLLRQQLDATQLTALLRTRQRCLDELLRRYPAQTRTWLQGAGSGGGDDPRPFLAAKPGTLDG